MSDQQFTEECHIICGIGMVSSREYPNPIDIVGRSPEPQPGASDSDRGNNEVTRTSSPSVTMGAFLLVTR
jgi:hypothetical protein